MAQDEPTKGLAPRPEALPLGLNRPQNGMLVRAKRTAGTVVGVGATLFSALGILGVFVGKSHDSLAATIVGCAFFAAFGTAGALLARRMIRAQRIASSPALAEAEGAPALVLAIRQRLLAIASHHRGRLTVAELAAALAIAPEPAEYALEEAAQSGEARLLFSPEGVPVYEFPGLLATKADAKEPWEL